MPDAERQCTPEPSGQHTVTSVFRALVCLELREVVDVNDLVKRTASQKPAPGWGLLLNTAAVRVLRCLTRD
jgi:hypothetical protein